VVTRTQLYSEEVRTRNKSAGIFVYVKNLQLMESFDIIIAVQDKEVSLTLQPEKAGTYKVIYHGMLVGEITSGEYGDSWRAVPMEEVKPGIYPMYEHDASKGIPRIVLDDVTLRQIEEAMEE
jgi:hypothetical protein